MKYLLDNARLPVVLTTLLLVVYSLLLRLGVPYPLVVSLFTVSQVAVPWMVFQVLKNGKAPERTLDKHEFGYLDIPEDFYNFK